MKHKKLKQGQSLSQLLEIDPHNQQCIDKITIISFVHGTGQLTLYTKKGHEIQIRLDDLINELKTETNLQIIKLGYNLFENILLIRYPIGNKKRHAEFRKIYEKTNIEDLDIYQSKDGYMEAKIEVNQLERLQLLKVVAH